MGLSLGEDVEVLTSIRGLADAVLARSGDKPMFMLRGKEMRVGPLEARRDTSQVLFRDLLQVELLWPMLLNLGDDIILKAMAADLTDRLGRIVMSEVDMGIGLARILTSMQNGTGGIQEALFNFPFTFRQPPVVVSRLAF